MQKFLDIPKVLTFLHKKTQYVGCENKNILRHKKSVIHVDIGFENKYFVATPIPLSKYANYKKKIIGRESSNILFGKPF